MSVGSVRLQRAYCRTLEARYPGDRSGRSICPACASIRSVLNPAALRSDRPCVRTLATAVGFARRPAGTVEGLLKQGGKLSAILL
jgi:hypothetical protein